MKLNLKGNKDNTVHEILLEGDRHGISGSILVGIDISPMLPSDMVHGYDPVNSTSSSHTQGRVVMEDVVYLMNDGTDGCLLIDADLYPPEWIDPLERRNLTT